MSATASASAANGFAIDGQHQSRAPGHQQAQPPGIAIAADSSANFAAADDQQPPADGEQLVEIAGDQKHRAAVGREFEQHAMHVGGGARSSPRQILCATITRGCDVERTRDLEPLAISARQRAGERLGTGARESENAPSSLATKIDRARGVEPSVRVTCSRSGSREKQIFP